MAIEENAELGATGAEGLRWSVVQVGEGIEVAIAGEMDLATTRPLTEALTRVLEAKPTVVTVDLADVSFLDSSGIRCLISAAREAESVGSRLVVRHPRPAVLRVMQMCAVDQLLLTDGAAAGDAASRIEAQRKASHGA
jgi:anti-sigma B factor antagonist